MDVEHTTILQGFWKVLLLMMSIESNNLKYVLMLLNQVKRNEFDASSLLY